jgi:signal transduction histidine kinase
MRTRNLKALKRKKNYILKWLERFKKSKELLPTIHKSLDLTSWEIEALENKPHDTEVEESSDKDYSDIDPEYLAKTLPMIPEINIENVFNLMVASTSGSSETFSFILNVRHEKENFRNTGDYLIGSYHKLQSRQSRAEDVRNLITLFNNNDLLDRFDRAYKSYSEFSVEVGLRTSTASEIRTLLYGIKGELFSLARNKKKENMNWVDMANRLHKGAKNGVEQTEILKQESIFSSLIDDLSKILKDREGESKISIEYIWVRVLDLLFVILTSTKINT